MADTALGIGCRKTIEVAGRLTAWLGRADVLSCEMKPVVETTLGRATRDLRRLMHSIEGSPCLGIVGGTDDLKIALFASAAFEPGSTTVSELSQLRIQQGTLPRLLGEIAGDDLGAAIRFRSAAMREPVNGAPRFPVQVDILGLIDITKIILTAYFSHCPHAAHGGFDQVEMERVIAGVDSELSTAPVSGLSGEDILDLRQHIWSAFPQVECLRALSASGYWDWLARHVAHLSLEGRCQVLSYLWHSDPVLTALFRCLAEALRDFGYASALRVPAEAIFGTGPDTGADAPHHVPLVRQMAVTGLLLDGNSANLTVSIGQGAVRTVSRPAVAALIHTVNLRVNRAAPFPLDATDAKVFPSPKPSVDFPTASLGGGSALDIETAEQLFARVKAIYTFARAVANNELSAVVAVADVETEPDDIHMQAIADWIELSEGADPRARERMENCLAILVKSPKVDAPDGNLSVNRDDRARFVSGLLGEHDRWAREWTPGRPFSQVHFISDFTPATDEPAPRLPDQSRATNNYEAADGIFPARGYPGAPLTAAANILVEIAANSSQVVRSRQVRRQLVTTQRAMQARMFRYHHSNNPDQFTDWRRQIANVATKRLEACGEQNTLGHMVSVLMMGQTEIGMLLAGLNAAAADASPIDEYSIDIDLGRPSLPDPAVCAEAIVAAWFKLMHDVAASRLLCARLAIAQPVFQHVVDELVIAAHRADLLGTLVAKFNRILQNGQPMGQMQRAYAVVAARAIGNFLERLPVSPKPFRVDPRSDRNPASRIAGMAAPRHLKPGAPGSSLVAPADPLSPSSRSVIDGWPARFRRVVEDNILAADALTVHGEADHELGEHLSMLTSNPLEVEL
ncbi:MAG: hypothetical protein KKB37_03060 [Alphaproteobacteria bacterium]|nr:hypothetical protein [Alphaproteobacteria bacterium]